MKFSRHLFTPAFTLGGLSLLAMSLVTLTEVLTREQINLNTRKAVLREIHDLVPPQSYDNDPLSDVISLSLTVNQSEEVFVVHRLRLGGHAVGAIFYPVAPDGYNGRIQLLAVIRPDGSLIGVRVIEHGETPGLGDFIELSKSSWIRHFDNKSLTNPVEKLWRVKKDGGNFDQFTGATITPRAVVLAIHRTLKVFEQQRQILFDQPIGARIK
jgi:electron transport complex protein RnfG